MSVINFDLSISPDPVTLGFQVSMDAKSATISLVPPVNLSVSAKPSTGTIVGGAIAGAILGGFVGGGITVGVVYGVAKAIGDTLTDKVKGELTGTGIFPYTVDFGAPLGFGFDVEGVRIHIEAASIQLSTFNGMLMAEGTASVT
jgi:hypothetical protein